jgi:hypothetical protein
MMFHEAWAATVRHAHPSCLEGLDPDSVLAAYAPLLPRVSCALELRDLMHEMQGERVPFHRRAPAMPRWLVRSEWIWL